MVSRGKNRTGIADQWGALRSLKRIGCSKLQQRLIRHGNSVMERTIGVCKVIGFGQSMIRALKKNFNT
jgi:hypothetical protein